ncbi:hypothetical protein LINGRAHAP2_LOCUS1841 [Linum grandiflorum]
MNRGRQFYRCPFWKDKTADCKFFRWASDRQHTAEESFMGESSMGVYNPNSKFDDRESLSVPKIRQTRIVDDESVGNDVVLDELKSLRVKVAFVEQRLRLGVEGKNKQVSLLFQRIPLVILLLKLRRYDKGEESCFGVFKLI